MNWAKDCHCNWKSCLLVVCTLVTVACSGGEGESSDSETGETSETETDGDSDSDTTAIDEGPWDSLDERPCPEGSGIDGQNFGIPFLLTHCNGCHGGAVTGDERQGAPPGVSFDNMDEVWMQLDRIWERSGDDNETMPPAGGPTPDERAMLGQWLACGAPLVAEE